jgi:MFS family permease
MIGIYYAAPLLGPSLGPLLGGVLSQIWGWRATFYFLTIIGGIVLVSLFLFNDTYRRERSLTYQSAARHALHHAEERARKRSKDVENGLPVIDPATVSVTLADLNLFTPIWNVLKRKNNLSMLLLSGWWFNATFEFSLLILCEALIFALQYSVGFTTARTFAAPPYNYKPLYIGLLLLSFGVGTYPRSLEISL